jgi:hypothetical protein
MASSCLDASLFRGHGPLGLSFQLQAQLLKLEGFRRPRLGFKYRYGIRGISNRCRAVFG